eukprot:TRINITY_DN444_c0_g1_i6.p1 TRINITY_DN444_c0_g1~~TRINITY_DN444_c0_g1_i6.p1  ORF type:complete len:636 (-),score=96.93 TRINITY_DN444_c0_g1_i6:532-2439(-)
MLRSLVGSEMCIRDRFRFHMHPMRLVLLCILAAVALSNAQTCAPPIFSWENSLQGWVKASGTTDLDTNNCVQTNAYSMMTGATAGSYSMRLAYDHVAGKQGVFWVVQDFDFSGSNIIKFDVTFGSGAHSSNILLSLSTGSSWSWYESTEVPLSTSSTTTVSFDLQALTWKLNGVTGAIQNISQIKRIAIIYRPVNVGFVELFIDNFRLCGNTPVAPTTVAPTQAPTTRAPQNTPTGFVTTQGTKFVIGNCPFYFLGTNVYYVAYESQSLVDASFLDMSAMGFTVLRTWGFLDIGSLDGTTRYNIDGKKNGVYFQYWDTATNAPKINEGSDGLVKLDYALSKAAYYNIKVIVALVNNWHHFGGMDQYVVWYQANNHDEFYTDARIKQAYKNYVNALVNRVNTYTGVRYKDDPTIFAWELANEPRCKGDNKPGSCSTTTIVNWAGEMSDYIKSIDPNHMIAVGDEGFFTSGGSWPYQGYLSDVGVDHKALTQLPSISFATLHLYPESWGTSGSWGSTWISEHIDFAHNVAGKPTVTEEFGYSSDQVNIYNSWLGVIDSQSAAGSLVWMLVSAGGYGDQFSVYNDGGAVSQVLKNYATIMTNKNVCTGTSAPTTARPTTRAPTTATPTTRATNYCSYY